jgi:hypothetical protein
VRDAADHPRRCCLHALFVELPGSAAISGLALALAAGKLFLLEALPRLGREFSTESLEVFLAYPPMTAAADRIQENAAVAALGFEAVTNPSPNGVFGDAFAVCEFGK